MLENKSYIKINISTERNFGIVFSIFFTIIGFYLMIIRNEIILWPFIVSLIFLFFSFFFSNFLIFPNKIWHKFGIILGALVAPFIMLLIFFLVISPIGIIMRLFKKNDINNKRQISNKSYWITKKESDSFMENQF